MVRKLKFNKTPLSGLYVVSPTLLEDDRGVFFRTYCQSEFSEIGFSKNFVQMNHSINYHKGTLRGLHFQSPQASEDKLIRCVKGSVFDVIVDLRQNSRSFLQHFALELSEKNKTMLLVPNGCAHGFLTLEDDSDMIYCHTGFYDSAEERGVKYDDPRLDISWPDEVKHISKRDASHPYLGQEFLGYNYEM